MINLNTYAEETRKSMGGSLWENFGLETSFMVSDFIELFDFNNYSTSYTLDDMFHDYADGSAAIYNKDLLKWLTDGNSCIKYINDLLQTGIIDARSEKFNIMDTIRIAQTVEIYDALNYASSEIESCLAAKYLIYLGYKEIEASVLDEFTDHFTAYNKFTPDAWFEETLYMTDYTEETCGTKSL